MAQYASLKKAMSTGMHDHFGIVNKNKNYSALYFKQITNTNVQRSWETHGQMITEMEHLAYF